MDMLVCNNGGMVLTGEMQQSQLLLCSPDNSHSNRALCSERPVTDCLSHGKACWPSNCVSYIYTGWSKSLCAPDDYNTESYFANSDCFTADRQGQGDTRLTLTPSIIPNSNYVIIVSDLNCFACFCTSVSKLKLFLDGTNIGEGGTFSSLPPLKLRLCMHLRIYMERQKLAQLNVLFCRN
jgi:hypothetical protein